MKKNKKEILKEENIKPENIIKETIHEKIDNLKDGLDVIKFKYDKVDEKTKNNVMFGIFGFLAFVTGIISTISLRNKNKKSKTK